jgi:hypothetical protein
MGFSNNEQLKNYVTDVFIETGTYHGDGVLTALNSGFNQVISIEIDADRYNHSTLRLSEQINNKSVKLYLGDVVNILPNILTEDLGKITFWLDAHETNSSDPCPLYKELEIIKSYKRNDCTILIDDLRCIKNNYGWGNVVDLDVLINQLKEINPNYLFSFENGQEGHVDDILVAQIK